MAAGRNESGAAVLAGPIVGRGKSIHRGDLLCSCAVSAAQQLAGSGILETGQKESSLPQCAGTAAFAVFGAGWEIGRSLIRGNKFYLGER